MLLPDEFVEAAGAPAARDDLESGFSHEPARKGGAAKVSTGQTSAYSHSILTLIGISALVSVAAKPNHWAQTRVRG